MVHSFFKIKLQSEALKKRLVQVFSSEFCEILIEHFLMKTSSGCIYPECSVKDVFPNMSQNQQKLAKNEWSTLIWKLFFAIFRERGFYSKKKNIFDNAKGFWPFLVELSQIWLLKIMSCHTVMMWRRRQTLVKSQNYVYLERQ